jgi:GAF domain-containing protein/methyl-accepting chemotaxis protein
LKFDQDPIPSESPATDHTTWWLRFSVIAALAFAASEFASLWMGTRDQAWLALPVFVAVPLFIWMVRQGKRAAAGLLFMAAIGLQALLAPTVLSGLGMANAITSLALISGIGFATLPQRYVGRILAAGAAVLLASVLIDLFGDPSRPAALLGQGRWIFAALILLLFGILFAREFLLLDLRTKIATGILATGGIALLVLILFAFYQARQITSTLSQRLNNSVNQLAEEQLRNTAFVEASRANQEFEDIAEEVTSLAQTWLILQRQKEVVNPNPYWDAHTDLIQHDEGQYANSVTDPSSVFVPAQTAMNEELIADLNVSAYLDFSAPPVLDEHPDLLALYAIDTRGVTRYYPNIDLAALLPPDFDATQRPHFLITSPMFNPQRLPRWTIPYVDATGGGLVVTVAAPVYDGSQFLGIVAADMQLIQITQQISGIRVGQTGYAFIIDDAGRILAMPQAGFDMFGIRPEDLNSNEFFKHTILGTGTDELRSLTNRMTAGGAGLLVVDNHGVDTYISYAPIKANGYSIALVVPVAELQGPILLARNETQQQFRDATQAAATLLVGLLVLAVAISLGLGKIIAAPIQRLTQVALQVTTGNLNVQAAATTNDEIGTLATAFNTMTSRLRQTLDDLEKRVDERTAELYAANEKNERRAKQFEAIAQIARSITSTRDLDLLLPQITATINKEFGFYHIGIFLLDAAGKYAVLSAANSEGGKLMLERGHRLQVGETGMVGYVTGTGKARVALDTGQDAVFFDNPYLPETRSALTLPLRVGDEIIGALDVQSTEPNAFLQDDINILSTLADQVSIAIQNAQQFELTRKALNESEVLSRQFVQRGWQQFSKTTDLLGIRHTGARALVLRRTNGKTREEGLLEMDQARRSRREASLSLPIRLHGEVIGSVDVHTPDNRPWDQDELEMATAIIERAAIAMENARLLAESQKRAAKERIIGEISSRISMQSEISELLKTAAKELGRHLPNADITVQFHKDTE